METQLTIEIENLAPTNATLLTPVWFGIHNGTFDTYDRGRPISPGLERLAEDGIVDGINREFNLAGFGKVQGAVFGSAGTPGPIDPGETGTVTVSVDGSDPTSRYFSYASMILPSNDFWISNGNERAHQIFDDQGNFLGADFTVLGSQVLDAGSEVNDEIPMNTAFFGQQNPNTGVTENGVVQLAGGFIPGGSILSTPKFANADFTAPNYQVARFRIFNTINGEDGSDDLTGTDKDDLINGNGGDDRLYGGLSNDKLVGGLGDDLLEGGVGNDRLIGGLGTNWLEGGAGSDLFVLTASEGFDTITDFSFGNGDRLSLSGSLSFSDLTITGADRDTLISSGGKELALLRNVDAASITKSAFA